MLEPFFAQADENEDGELDSVEFAGFRSAIRSRAVKSAGTLLPEFDQDGDGLISQQEAERKTRLDDDMSARETEVNSQIITICTKSQNSYNLIKRLEIWEMLQPPFINVT